MQTQNHPEVSRNDQGAGTSIFFCSGDPMLNDLPLEHLLLGLLILFDENWNMNGKSVKQAVVGKLKSFEATISRVDTAIKLANDYLETGEHADWHGFRPLFVGKFKDGKPCPPHTDRVINFFLRDCRRPLRDASRALERLEERQA